jgi:amino-acid N-acetyltransferase
MRATLAKPEMQATINSAGDDWQETHTGELQQPVRSPQMSGEGITYRRGRPEAVPELARVIAEAKLPAFFIEEFAGGFAFAEQDGRMIAAGGMEVYESYGFLRSIAVDERARGLGLGRKIADLLRADAKASGLDHLFLYTQDAYTFWKHLGYVDVAFDAWPAAMHECWQYRFMMDHMDLVRAIGVHSMWRPV